MNLAEQMKYADLVDIPRLQALMERFNEVVGIANAVIDVDGTVIVHAGWQRACTDFHRVNPQSCRLCVESDTSLVESMTRGSPFAVYRCHNGLVDTAARIVVAGKHVANVFTGQFLTAPPDTDFFRSQAQRFGYDEADYLGAIRQVPIVSRERVESITRLYAQLASMMADSGLDRIRQREATRALARLNATLEDTVAARTRALAQANQELSARESLLKQILDTSSVAIFVVDAQGCITQANQRMAEMFGLSLAELVGAEYVSLIHPDERNVGRDKMRALLTSEIAAVDLDRLYWRADQSEFWGHLTGRRLHHADGTMIGLVGVIADINARKLAEQKLQLAANVFSHAREGIMITAPDGCIIDVNEAFTRITGYPRDEVIGRNPSLLASERHDAAYFEAMWQALIGKGHWYGEIWNRRRNGEEYIQLQTVTAVRDPGGNIRHFVALFSDITAQKEHERRLEHIAHYDALTRLPNRVLLADRMQQAMTQAQRRSLRLAVAYLDLDGFKAVNDRHGHELGDQLLINLANSMRQILREGDTLARLGGDEFVAVLGDLSDTVAVEPMLDRLLATVAQPLNAEGCEFRLSASLGVTFYPQSEEVDADQLLRQADQAMYQAKLAGKNRYHVFDAEQDRHVRGHHESLEHIARALAEKEFVLHYQPKVNMRTGKVIGAEALIRWQHPERGLLAPAAFLPVIEDHSLAIQLGEWVIDTALKQMEQWQATGLSLPISVNIGARQLQQAHFVDRLKTLLAAHPDITPDLLELEVLETSALEDMAQASSAIAACCELGVRCALDDFGTGYSSLSYLKQLPVSQLKIDRSFVRDMLDDPDDLAILEGVLGLASAFRRQVIAEGVESLAHGQLLLQLGCELAQGYGIARPMPGNAFANWVAEWRPALTWSNTNPVSRDDQPLLHAIVEHRAFIAAVASYLAGERTQRPALDAQHCRLALWQASDASARHRSNPAFANIATLHHRLHQQAGNVLEQHAKGQVDAQEAGLSALNDLGTSLLAQLEALVHTPLR
ncbi:EAL domain-containing protein [Azoarcus communis]|uniref:EAL domain-containing protein n=1 Tax=Parazoarcus communis TaxID=41977 RepID=UPI001459B9F9|nr:EAL domain-containing protein [Parazoarcus communis]